MQIRNLNRITELALQKLTRTQKMRKEEQLDPMAFAMQRHHVVKVKREKERDKGLLRALYYITWCIFRALVQ